MEGRSQIVRMSAAPTSWEMVKEHYMLYLQCYCWLRDAKRSNVERKAAGLRAQRAERAVKGAINKLLKTGLPRGSAHKKVRALIDALQY